MKTHGLRIALSALVGLCGLAIVVSAALGASGERRDVSGTLWVANRGAHTIRAFDAASGSPVRTLDMRGGSQPGDLAVAKGKLYVAEEFGSPPAIAVVDAASGELLKRIETGPRPHHVHASPGGNLVAYGVFGTNRIGIVDARSDTLVGEWRSSERPEARAHAGVFSPDGRTVYVANDVVGELSAVDARTGRVEWTMTLPGVHELAVSHDGKTAYVSARSAGRLHIVDLERRAVEETIDVPAPDTLRLSPNQKLLTIGLRSSPARLAVLDTETLDYDLVAIGGPGTLAGHQWTSPTGRYTFAAFEGPGAGVAVIDHDNNNAVVQTLDYPGRPHGVDFTRR